jgi:hypothetical protein
MVLKSLVKAPGRDPTAIRGGNLKTLYPLREARN